MENKQLIEFAKTISGIFSNKEQALNNPKNFAHIQIHIRPLLIEHLKCYAFYSEQRFQHDIWNPYKQSVNKLSQEKDIFVMSNHRVENKERLAGGALEQSILNIISNHSLYEVYGCSMHFKEDSPGNFLGHIEPGEKCFIQRETRKTYVKSEVKLTKNTLISEDSGYEKETNKKVWGSNFGPLIFKKIKNFDKFIDSNWK